jgi:hypothetical protein
MYSQIRYSNGVVTGLHTTKHLRCYFSVDPVDLLIKRAEEDGCSFADLNDGEPITEEGVLISSCSTVARECMLERALNFLL